MSGDKYKPVRPNDRLRIPAATYNAMIAAARAHEQSKFDAELNTEADPFAGQSGICKLLNESGSDRDRFSILELTGPLIEPDDNEEEFLKRAAFRGADPTADATGKFGILREPIPAGRIGLAVVLGVTPCKVDIRSEAHKYADAESGEHEHLVSAETGSGRILWKPSGMGTKLCIVMVGGGGGGGEVQVDVPINVALTTTHLEFDLLRIWVNRTEELETKLQIPLTDCAPPDYL